MEPAGISQDPRHKNRCSRPNKDAKSLDFTVQHRHEVISLGFKMYQGLLRYGITVRLDFGKKYDSELRTGTEFLEKVRYCFPLLWIATSPMDCHLNVVGRFEFSMILGATPSVVFNHFHQGHPWR